MSTNYYVRGFDYDDTPGRHLAKRSMSGPYCYTCKETLCADGENAIHDGKSKWNEVCTKCGEKGKPSCSISWAIAPALWEQFANKLECCPSCERKYNDPEKCIQDEYGRLFTIEGFKKVIDECPIHYTNMVGKYFS